MKATREFCRAGLRRTAALAMVCVATTMTIAARPAPRQHERTCQDVTVPTHVIPGSGHIDAQQHGRLCLPASGESSALQVLVPGYTEGAAYWDMPGFGERYSYASTLNSAGYATVVIDPLGTGESTHPPGALVTENALAGGVHDVVQWARSGRSPGGPYHRIATVGHSYGTSVTDLEAATYHDIDGTIATGATHLEGPLALGELVAASAYPAVFDPRLRREIGQPDPTYLTTQPGTRGELFHAPGDSNPAVIAREETTKETATVGQLATTPEYVVPTVTRSINAPALVVQGAQDKFFCAEAGGGALESCRNSQTLRSSEAPFWSPQAQLEAYVLPQAGHAINLANNAGDWFQTAIAWSRRHLPLS